MSSQPARQGVSRPTAPAFSSHRLDDLDGEALAHAMRRFELDAAEHGLHLMRPEDVDAFFRNLKRTPWELLGRRA